MPSKNTEIFEFNLHQKSDKASFITNGDIEYLIEKIDGCKNNPENSFTKKENKHIPTGFLMSAKFPCKKIENKHGVYNGKDCMEKH